MLNSSTLNVSFRRSLVGNRLTDWHNIVASVAFTNLNEGLDSFVWGLKKDGIFAVKSMYSYLGS